MKILHLISSTGLFGAENVMLALAREQVKQGLNVWVGVFNNSRNPHLEIVEAANAHNIPKIIFDCRGKLDFKTITGLRSFIKNNAIDLIHSHGYKSDFYSFLATLFKKTKRVATCHTWYSINKKMKFYELVDKILLPRFNMVVAVSKTLKNELLKCKVPKEKVIFIENGIDITLFHAHKNLRDVRMELNIDPDCKIIGTIGRLTPDKGQIYLLRAFRKVTEDFPGIKCLIVGDGPLRMELEMEAGKSNVDDKVIFTGIRKDVPQLLSLMDIFVLSSLKEGLPMVLLEAMALRKPIITTKVGAIPELIENDQTGLLTEPADVEGIYNSIIFLLKNVEKAKILGDNAFEKAKTDFSTEKMARNYIKAYKETLN